MLGVASILRADQVGDFGPPVCTAPGLPTRLCPPALLAGFMKRKRGEAMNIHISAHSPFLPGHSGNCLLAVCSEATETDLMKEAEDCLNAAADILYLITTEGPDGHNSAIRGARRLVELAEAMMNSSSPCL